MLAPPIIEEIHERIRDDGFDFGIFRDAEDPSSQPLIVSTQGLVPSSARTDVPPASADQRYGRGTT